MVRYLIRRLALTVPVLLGVATLVFALIHLVPGDPAQSMLGEGASPEEVLRLRHNLGLDRPLLVQYQAFLTGLVRGDLGSSFRYGTPVTHEIRDRLFRTLQLAVAAMTVAILFAIAMFRASGAMEALTRALDPVLGLIGFPAELLPMAIIRSLSGSGSAALVVDMINQYGEDSILVKIAAVMYGSSETTFYVIAVYFGAVGIKKTRHAVPAGLIENGTSGWLVADGDFASLIAKANELVADPATRARMAERARVRVEPYLLPRVARQWAQILNTAGRQGL